MDSILTFNDAATFKEIVERHKAEGWANLDGDKKLFICDYIKSGYSLAPLIERGVPSTEAETYIRDPLVQAAIADVGDQYAEVSAFTTVGLRAKLARALDMALGEVPMPMYDKEGSLYMRKQVNLQAATKLIEMAERHATGGHVEGSTTPAPWER